MLSKPVEEAVEGLIELGVLSEKGLVRLARLFEALKALKQAGAIAAPEEPAGGEPEPESRARERPEEGAREKTHEPQAPDPEFTDDLPAPQIQSPPSKLKVSPIPGFIRGYSEENLKKDPAVSKPRRPRGSFHVTQQDLMALRTPKTIQQIAAEYGGSVCHVMHTM